MDPTPNAEPRRDQGRSPGAVLLVSTYELGREPLGLAWPMAFLARAGIGARALDLAVDTLDAAAVREARLVAFSVPMHTALRLATRTARRVRELNPRAHVCFFGLYALLNAEYLLRELADSVLGGECEETLVALVADLASGGRGRVAGVRTRDQAASPVLNHLDFPPPDRTGLGPLERYARLEVGAETRLAAAVEASRGCLHLCSHCPIPPVYGGRFFAVPVETVVSDVRALVARGARHLSYADADFLNGPTHALRVARAVHTEFPELSFDFTAKVEHLVRHRALLAELRELGGLFAVSAFESLSDKVLAALVKGHTRADLYLALRVAREAGLTLRPTFVAFTPWTTLADYLAMLEFVEREGLVDHVDPVQYGLRLLVPPGSLLLASAELKPYLGALEEETLSHFWRHTDTRVDALQGVVAALVAEASQLGEDAEITFLRVKLAALEAAREERRGRARPPRLSEDWFC